MQLCINILESLIFGSRFDGQMLINPIFGEHGHGEVTYTSQCDLWLLSKKSAFMSWEFAVTPSLNSMANPRNYQIERLSGGNELGHRREASYGVPV